MNTYRIEILTTTTTDADTFVLHGNDDDVYDFMCDVVADAGFDEFSIDGCDVDAFLVGFDTITTIATVTRTN